VNGRRQKVSVIMDDLCSESGLIVWVPSVPDVRKLVQFPAIAVRCSRCVDLDRAEFLGVFSLSVACV